MNVYFALLDWIHLLAAVVWIGGIIFYVMILFPSSLVLDPPQRGKLMGAIMKRYAPITWAAIILLIVTGILINIERGIATISLSSTYGILFFIKHNSTLRQFEQFHAFIQIGVIGTLVAIYFS